jgi:hypothetical protein
MVSLDKISDFLPRQEILKFETRLNYFYLKRELSFSYGLGFLHEEF